MTDKTNIFDSLEVVARDSRGWVKDLRFLKPFAGRVWQFIPNRFFLHLLNNGHRVPRIPGLFGSWSVVNV